MGARNYGTGVTRSPFKHLQTLQYIRNNPDRNARLADKEYTETLAKYYTLGGLAESVRDNQSASTINTTRTMMDDLNAVHFKQWQDARDAKKQDRLDRRNGGRYSLNTNGVPGYEMPSVKRKSLLGE